jgi:DNA-binding GntR family transcriptional regulator
MELSAPLTHTVTQAPVQGPDRSDRRSMVEVAYQALKQRIISHELAPGVQVLEEDLALMLGMSRTPVREAAVRLEQEGFLELVPRRGIRVRPLSKRAIREINEVLECLEIQAAERLASRHLSAEELKRLEGAVANMDAALATDDIKAWAQADYEFHRLLIEMCGNDHLAEVAQNFLDKAHRFRLLTLPLRAKPIYSNVNHAAVVEAVRRNDPQTAQDIHRAHKRRWNRELVELLDRLDLPE